MQYPLHERRYRDCTSHLHRKPQTDYPLNSRPQEGEIEKGLNNRMSFRRKMVVVVTPPPHTYVLVHLTIHPFEHPPCYQSIKTTKTKIAEEKVIVLKTIEGLVQNYCITSLFNYYNKLQ